MAKDFKNFGSDMQRNANKAKTMIHADLPRVVSVLGVNHFKGSWENQGFMDASVKKWKSRKAPKAGTAAYRRFMHKEGRPILYSYARDRKGTHLKDSLRGRAMRNRVVFETDKVYAQVHNEGGRAGRGAGFTMPQRQFMGKSQALDNKIEDKANRMVSKLINEK